MYWLKHAGRLQLRAARLKTDDIIRSKDEKRKLKRPSRCCATASSRQECCRLLSRSGIFKSTPSSLPHFNLLKCLIFDTIFLCLGKTWWKTARRDRKISSMGQVCLVANIRETNTSGLSKRCHAYSARCGVPRCFASDRGKAWEWSFLNRSFRPESKEREGLGHARRSRH